MFFSHGILVLMVMTHQQLLTSSYSQVSRSGPPQSRSRSNSNVGQTPWTHSSDAHIVKGQNLSVRKTKQETDGIGEVFQERFNPRPWFAYETANKGPAYIPPPSNKPSMDLTVPFDSFPLSLPSNKNKPSALLKPPFDAKDNAPPNTPTPSNFVTPNNNYEHPPPEHHPQIDYSDDSLPADTSPGLPAYLEHDPDIHGYTFHDNHPPIYHELKHSTTEEPEKQRLNKRPYSYYYIGRKLWYIPLYFSVYFIIYIFVLILKSIARHKITFNQYFEDDKREMKNMPEYHDEHVHELEHHVYNDIMSAKRKYIM